MAITRALLALARWGGSLLLVALLSCWAWPGTVDVDLAESHSVRVTRTRCEVLLWPVPRADHPPELFPPDTLGGPLWLLLAALAAPTALLWWLRAARPRARGRHAHAGQRVPTPHMGCQRG